jgi:Fe-S-cluster containining protein
MGRTLQDIVDNLDKYRIRLDDIFEFRCRSCGKCCKNREDILLNPRDVYNLATALKLTNKQVIDQYCEVYIGRDSQIPIVRLKPKGVNRACPLLKGTRCSVHSLKPTICALFPIGRVMSSEDAPEELGLGNPKEIQYIISPAGCASLRKKQTVRAWLEAFNIPVDDYFFIAWNKTLFELIKIIKRLDPVSNENSLVTKMLNSAICQAVYLDYSAEEEFLPQFDSNIIKILKTLESLENATKATTRNT